MRGLRSFAICAGAALALALPPAAQARSAPIATFDDVAIATSDGRKLTLEQVQRAVVRAASSRKWTASAPKPNVVRARYTKGRHTAVVDVVFTTKSYSIKYVDSTDLNYSEAERSIHPAYNKAVNELRQGIDAQLRIAR